MRRTFCGRSSWSKNEQETGAERRSGSRKSMSKMDEVLYHHHRVTYPIRLLHESTMMELYQEQLRPPSPVQYQKITPKDVLPPPASLSLATGTSTSSLPQVTQPDQDLTGTVRPTPGSTDEIQPVTVEEVMAPNAAAVLHNSSIMDEFDTATIRECQICYDKLDALQAHICVACCGSFCSSCTRWYIEYKVLEGEVSRKKLICPAPQCTRPLPEEVIEAYVSQETFQKYLTFLKNQKAGIRFCPRAGCCAILNEPLFSKERRVKCQRCEQESCMRCGSEYHKMPFCRRVEKRFNKWRKRHNVRPCPHCRSDIEKQGGCCHMKCFQCDQEFCWSCLRSWESHDETLCLPLSFFYSKSPKYGCWTPLRVVTKTAVLGVAAVVVVAGVGVAVVVVPPVIAYHAAKDSYRKSKYTANSVEVRSGSVPLE